MTKRKLSGYVWRQEVQRARMAASLARVSVQRILTEGEGNQKVVYFLLARAATALVEIREALDELEKIGEGKGSKTG